MPSTASSFHASSSIRAPPSRLPLHQTYKLSIDFCSYNMKMDSQFPTFRPVLLLFFLFLSTATSFNITSILGNFSDFSVFNSYLTQTGLVVDINSRSTITVLATNNDAISVLSNRNLPVDSIKRIISLHVVLDYYDQSKLKQFSGKSNLLTTLFQTTGTATNQEGFLNATYLNSGDIMFGSGVRGSGLTSKFVKEVNITSTLLSSGFQSFADLLQSTGAIQTYLGAENNGLTLFAPVDKAIQVLPSNLTDDERRSLALYHAVSGYHPMEYLNKVTGPLSTLASNGNSNFQITVKTNAQKVTLNSGLNTVNVGRSILDQQQIAIFAIDAALQPPEIFASNGTLPPPSNTPPTPPTPAAPAPTAPSPSAPSPVPSGGSPPSDSGPTSSPAASPPTPSTAETPAADSPAANGPPADAKPLTPAASPPDDSSASRLYSSCFAAVLSIFYCVVV
ncbi:Fasciclin-like arabinogalactan protein 8 [Nymphaea thermarum]|nr:Fasciclin-like arabinogalactan protein 8 [Nymphaea thermarum]